VSSSHFIENYSTSKPLKVSPEKSQILSCGTFVANEWYVVTFVRPRTHPLNKCTKISFYTSGIQPDDGYFGVAETCSCNLQLLHWDCAMTGCKPQTRCNTECKLKQRSIVRVRTVTADRTSESIKAHINLNPL